MRTYANSIQDQHVKITSVPKQVICETQNELFEKYVKPYLNMIYWICIKYSLCRFYIDDNYNEVLLNFYRYIHTYNSDRGHIKTWLYAVAVRAIIKINERNPKIINDYDVSLISDDFFYYDVENSKKENYLINYRLLFSDDILYALEKLKAIHREALLLHLSGYKMCEIAQISYLSGNLESKNIETVKARLHSAKIYMQQLIDKNGKKRI